ncbi:MAG: hypothetical protein RR404_04110, partial [Bacilli bacterium]
KARQLYLDVEEKNGKVDIKRLNKIKSWIKVNIFTLVPKESTDKGYLKIFFLCDLKEYKKESEKYLLPNIYNNTDFLGLIYQSFFHIKILSILLKGFLF